MTTTTTTMTATTDSDATEALPPLPASARGALLALSLSMLLSSLGISIATVGLPTLAQAFDAGLPQVKWVVVAYLMAVTALVVGAGRLGDRIGRKRLLLAGLALFSLASGACGLAPTLAWLIAARAAQGAGAAVMLALTISFVADTVPKARTGRAMGWLGTTSAVGTALGPTLGGALIAGFGWRAMFVVSLPLGALAWGLARRHLPDDHAGEPVARPRLRLAMLRAPLLGASLAMNLLVAMVMMATLVVGPFHLSGALGLDAARVGLALTVGPLVAALAGVPAGRLTDRFGGARMTLAGLATMLTGCVMLAMLAGRFGVAGYVLPLALVTAGYAQFQAASQTALMAATDAPQRGTAAGLLMLARHVGLIGGAAAIGAVFAAVSAASGSVASGTRASFALAALLIVGALVIGAGRAAWVVGRRALVEHRASPARPRSP